MGCDVKAIHTILNVVDRVSRPGTTGGRWALPRSSDREDMD